MCNGQSCLGYFLLVIIVGFSGFIFFLIKYRKFLLKRNLLITSDQVWSKVANRAANLNLSKSDLIFGIWQDESATTKTLLVKDYKNETVGRVNYQMASRKFKIIIGNEKFEVVFPLTWNREAKLFSGNNETALASYLKLSVFGKHQFGIPGYGVLISERPNFSPRIIFNYRLNGNLVGTTEDVTPVQKAGRLAILPSNLPLPIRIFILAV